MSEWLQATEYTLSSCWSYALRNPSVGSLRKRRWVRTITMDHQRLVKNSASLTLLVHPYLKHFHHLHQRLAPCRMLTKRIRHCVSWPRYQSLRKGSIDRVPYYRLLNGPYSSENESSELTIMKKRWSFLKLLTNEYDSLFPSEATWDFVCPICASQHHRHQWQHGVACCDYSQ